MLSHKTTDFFQRASTRVGAILVMGMLLSGCAAKTPGTLSSIEDIYRQWKSYSNLSYELHVLKHEGKDVGTDENGAVKFFTKGTDRSRIEVVTKGEPSVMIYNGAKNLNILFYPNNNQYIDAGFGQDKSGQLNLAQEIDDFYSQIKDKYKIAGQEKFKDTMALVLDGPGTDTDRQKVWVSASTGLPLKLQTIDPKGQVVNDFEFTNHSTAELADGLFDIPADAKEISFDDFLKKLMPKSGDAANSVDPK